MLSEHRTALTEPKVTQPKVVGAFGRSRVHRPGLET